LSTRNATGPRTALRLIVAAQMAMSLVLIAGAGLFTRSLAALRSQTLGIDREHVLLVWTAPGQTGREGAALALFAQQAVDRLKTLPGARAVGASNHGPLEGGADAGGASELLRVEGRPPKAGMQITRTAVTPGFFASVGAPLVAGRDFTERDTERAPQVAVVGDNLARFLFGSESAIGRRFIMGSDAPAIEIVGVAPAIRHGSPRDLRGNIYVPVRQQPGLFRTMCLEILTTGEPSALAPAARAELGRLDPHLPVLHVDTVDQQLGDVLVRERLIAQLASTFAVVAMLLTGAGLYALTAYQVAQRTAEIGIRVALGAPPHRILWLTARDNLAMLAAGTAAGVALAFAAGRFVSSLLFGAGSFDAPTIAAAALILAGVATVAASLPARRAARLDPIAALRCD
jgi:predicted permease